MQILISKDEAEKKIKMILEQYEPFISDAVKEIALDGTNLEVRPPKNVSHEILNSLKGCHEITMVEQCEIECRIIHAEDPLLYFRTDSIKNVIGKIGWLKQGKTVVLTITERKESDARKISPKSTHNPKSGSVRPR